MMCKLSSARASCRSPSMVLSAIFLGKLLVHNNPCLFKIIIVSDDV